MMQDLQRLAEIFSPDAPCGVNLRTDDLDVYYRIRDVRSAAKSEDRSNELAASGKIPEDPAHLDDIVRPSQVWRELGDLCLKALTTRTKDIELFAWLAEAQARTADQEALAATISALAQLCETHFPELYSLEVDTLADKVEPIAGLNGALNFEGTLIRPLRLMSLLPDHVYGRFNLWTFDKVHRNVDGPAWVAWRKHLENADGQAFQARRNSNEALGQAFKRLDAALTEQCGGDAPALTKISALIEDMRHAYTIMATHVKLAVAPLVEKIDTASDASASQSVITTSQDGEIRSREQAFAMLLQVADYFRRAEPHSYISYALDTVVQRGRMDFFALLTELIPQNDIRRDILTRAGVRQPGEGG